MGLNYRENAKYLNKMLHFLRLIVARATMLSLKVSFNHHSHLTLPSAAPNLEAVSLKNNL